MRKFILPFITCLIVLGCGNNKMSKMLVGKWGITHVTSKSFDEMKPDMKENFEKMMAEIHKDSYMEYRDDGNFELNATGMSESGTWEFNPDDSTITTKLKSNKKTKIKVLELSQNSLKLSVLQEKDTDPMVISFDRK